MMTMSEESRHRLYRRLEDVLGPDEAATLMEHVPPVPAQEQVTREVLRGELAVFRTEFADFRGDMRAEFAEFQGAMRAEFAEFRGAMRAEFAEFRGEIRAALHDQTRTLLLSLVGLQISAAGLVVAVSRLV